MREFFRGWRRKAGVVTLVMACVVFGAPMRSIDSRPGIVIHAGDTLVTCHIVMYGIDCTRWINPKYDWPEMALECGAHIPVPAGSAVDPFFHIILDRHWKFCGFEYGEGCFDTWGIFRIKRLVIPYWPFTLSLTLLSAYLLLVPPRRPPPTASQPHA